jgi:hypothetical protein
MNSVVVASFSASISIGLNKGYTAEIFGKKELIAVIRDFQKKLIAGKNIHLSANITECELVLGDYSEPHIKIEFINFPRYPVEEIVFKEETKNLAFHLMEEFRQNRIVIIYHDETIMFEKNPEEGPVIRF